MCKKWWFDLQSFLPSFMGHHDQFQKYVSHLPQMYITNIFLCSFSVTKSAKLYPTGGSLDFSHIMMQGDGRRRRNDNYFDDIPRSKLERQMAQVKHLHNDISFCYACIFNSKMIEFNGIWRNTSWVCFDQSIVPLKSLCLCI